MIEGRSNAARILLSGENLLRLLGENVNEFIHQFNKKQKRMFEINKAHGFEDGPQNFGEKIALTHGELSEALEYFRKGNGPSDHIPEFLGVEEELADTVIRCMNIAESWNLKLAEAIEAKAEFNNLREYRHGGKAF